MQPLPPARTHPRQTRTAHRMPHRCSAPLGPGGSPADSATIHRGAPQQPSSPARWQPDLKVALCHTCCSHELSYLHRPSPVPDAFLACMLPCVICKNGEQSLFGSGSTFGKRLHSSTSSAWRAGLLTSACSPARWHSTMLASVKHATSLHPCASPFTSSSTRPATGSHEHFHLICLLTFKEPWRFRGIGTCINRSPRRWSRSARRPCMLLQACTAGSAAGCQPSGRGSASRAEGACLIRTASTKRHRSLQSVNCHAMMNRGADLGSRGQAGGCACCNHCTADWQSSAGAAPAALTWHAWSKRSQRTWQAALAYCCPLGSLQ